MEQILFYFVHWGIPLIILTAIFLSGIRTRFGLLSAYLFNLCLLWFLYLWGQWPIAASIYLKYFLILIIGVNTFKAVIRYRRSKKSFPTDLGGKIRNSAIFLIGCYFGYLTFEAYRGRIHPEPIVSLQFPLKNGNYYIASGGSNRVLNNHFNRGSKSQRYAIDINKLDSFGRISSSFIPSENMDHYIFGAKLYAPCTGSVISLENNVEDNLGTNLNVSNEQGQGNYVVLDCSGLVVSLVHLKKSSIRIAKGDMVKSGEYIGRVGNSGFSQEPHLHLQTATYDADSVLVGVPMKFDEQPLYRNNLIAR